MQAWVLVGNGAAMARETMASGHGIPIHSAKKVRCHSVGILADGEESGYTELEGWEFCFSPSGFVESPR